MTDVSKTIPRDQVPVYVVPTLDNPRRIHLYGTSILVAGAKFRRPTRGRKDQSGTCCNSCRAAGSRIAAHTEGHAGTKDIHDRTRTVSVSESCTGTRIIIPVYTTYHGSCEEVPLLENTNKNPRGAPQRMRAACARMARRTPNAAVRCRTLVTKWQRAVDMLPSQSLLPPALGGEADVQVAAFYGDKLLGAYVAMALRRLRVEPRAQNAARLVAMQNFAVSNEHLHMNFAHLMPQHAERLREQSENGRIAGTMVEAAVTAVHDKDDHDAIIDLAEYLVHQALEQEASGLQHAKQKLLELGGTVTCERAGGPDHAPIFVAVAELGGQRISAQGAGSKAQLEKRVAAQLLESVFSSDY